MPSSGAAGEAPADRSERNGQKDVGEGRKEGRGCLLIGPRRDDGRQGMDKQEELMGIERSLWTNDAAIYEATYSPDAILIFPEVGRIGLELALEAIRVENAAGRHWAEVGFAGVSVTRIASDVELFTYEATARWNDEKNPARTLCATLYARRGDTWRVLFHQQTSV
jgi:Domain of unknown function (DUF4440)